MCWAPYVEILDWWHLVEKVWDVAATLFPSDTAAIAPWVETQKSHLWHGRPRALLKAIR
ncbi:MAG: hypothetical protein KDI62_24530 [Anaerolineae bacterium]|nr:hypothetical protein [Anaerolineae bacterium]